MPVFTYRGVNKTGDTVAGERSAANKAELQAALRREQINVSKLSEKGKEFNIPSFGGSGVKSKGAGHLYAPILGHDRRRPAAGAVPGNSRRAAGEQNFPESAERRRAPRSKAAPRSRLP